MTLTASSRHIKLRQPQVSMFTAVLLLTLIDCAEYIVPFKSGIYQTYYVSPFRFYTQAIEHRMVVRTSKVHACVTWAQTPQCSRKTLLTTRYPTHLTTNTSADQCYYITRGEQSVQLYMLMRFQASPIITRKCRTLWGRA